MTDPEHFSHEDKMRAGNATLDVLEAIENTDLQRHLLDARNAVQRAARNLEEQGFTEPRLIFLALIGVVLDPIMPALEGEEGP